MQCVELARKTGFANAYLSTLEGRIALRESGHAKAVELFRTAVQLSEAEYRPRDAWPHFYLGRSLLKIGETEEAIDVLYKGDEIVTGGRRPDKRLALAIRTQLLVAYVYSENWEAAKEIAELIGSEHSRNPEVIWALTLYRVATNKYEKPDEVIKATLRQLDPAEAKDRYQRSQVHLFRAFMFLGLDELSRASDEFSRAHAADSTNVFVMLRWAQTLVGLAHESGADDEPETARHCAEHAKTLAEKVLEFDHKNEEALRILESLSDDFNVT
ncbi:MAG: hypothetical protein KDA86_26390 [Planctomycetaceae bacterium]|nr:hypothetical protein [Planctomycetaceae bacterium]